MKKENVYKLKGLGISLDTIYNDFDDDYAIDFDACYYDSDRYYDEDGISIRKGSTYNPSRFAA